MLARQVKGRLLTELNLRKIELHVCDYILPTVAPSFIKDGLLACKRCSFRLRKVAFYKPKGRLL